MFIKYMICSICVGTTILCAISHAEGPVSPDRRTEVHLYGGAVTKDQMPLVEWYHAIGITDAWLYPVKGAFPQDQRPETQQTIAQFQADKILETYRNNHVRYWWFERPVPDFAYATFKRADTPDAHLWDTRPESDSFWSGVCENVQSIYPAVAEAGFQGLVFDNEAYYSFKGDESGKTAAWVWGGHDQEYGKEGQYYKRGLQVGQAIRAVWPNAKVIMAYAFGYAGERWWYQGFQDAGLEVFIGPEHTYGAGPPIPGAAWYQSWWQGKKTKEVCDSKRIAFPFVADNQHVVAGLFPIHFGQSRPNYRMQYFREQMASAANSDARGPIAVWLWPEGAFTPESLEKVQWESGDAMQDFLQVLREFSQAFSEESPVIPPTQ